MDTHDGNDRLLIGIDPAITRERLRLNAHSEFLAKMIDQFPDGSELSVRKILLIASVLKLRQMARAVDLLGAHGFVEEIQILGRTMAEIVINSAYLQTAPDEEVTRFVHFDTQSMYKHANQLRPHVTRKLSPEEEAKIETAVAAARSLTGKGDDKPSWSNRQLVQRGEYSDKATGLDLMEKLARTAYAYGHSAVHGTYDALEPFVPVAPHEPSDFVAERQEGASIAMASVNFTLCTLCFYLNSLLRLGLDHEIVKAGTIDFPARI